MHTATIAARHILTVEGWQQDVTLHIEAGKITRIRNGIVSGIPVYDCVLPGMPNVHSQAFQRGIAGLTEQRNASDGGKDNFWSWRAQMYRFVERLEPSHVLAIARWLYIEMLKAGYTHVGESHYLHHQPDGSPYAQDDMARAILQAANDSGIGLTLLPVLYAASDFGGKPANNGQRRFLHTVQEYLKLLSRLKPLCEAQDTAIGIAPHSLRAVTPAMLQEILGALGSMGMRNCPKHIHIAEQLREVENCLSWSASRPVEWILDNLPIDASWCFIHATHVSDSEVAEMARSKAIVGLCPTTEANLGDGVFPMLAFLRAGGRFAIGSDSHISVNAVEELRLLEYGQRLAHQGRGCVNRNGSCGRTLWQQAVEGGSYALGVGTHGLAEGETATLLGLSFSSPLFAGKNHDTILDTAIFALPTLPVQDVYVKGKKVIENGHHPQEETAAHACAEALKELR